MDIALTLLLIFAIWRGLCLHYQRTHIALLGRHLADLQLERHMETLTEGYTRAIREKSATRQLQVLETFTRTEHAVATQAQSLADTMQKENEQATSVAILRFCIPFVERILPAVTRDFRELLHIHAAGLRYVVDNEERLDPKSRAYHLSAELYLLQHSCHWFCKSRAVADARLVVRHQVSHQNVLDAVSGPTRSAYQRWLQSSGRP